MPDWRCARCRAQVAPGAPRCPECPSTQFIKPEAEADEVTLKIARDGGVSDSADVAAVPAEQERPGTGEPTEGTEAPADGTPVEIGSDPVPGEPEPEPVTRLPAGESAVPGPIVPPRPPRRTPPPAQGA